MGQHKVKRTIDGFVDDTTLWVNDFERELNLYNNSKEITESKTNHIAKIKMKDSSIGHKTLGIRANTDYTTNASIDRFSIS